jgi:hypothetical protein
MLFDTSLSVPKLFALIAGGCITWDHLLAHLGRRAWLPFMEES